MPRRVDSLSSKNLAQKGNQVREPLSQEVRFFSLLKNFLLSSLIFLLIIFIGCFSVLNLGFIQDRINLAQLFFQGQYLVIFQNNTELRPTGGFIGSFATLETKFLFPRNLQINTNIYKMDDKYDYVLQIQPPEPLKAVLNGKYWAMRDANWSVDFSESARKVAWFYQQEGGMPVDGIIALNATVIRDLLRIIGPIELPQYQIFIDENNFFDVLHYKIEKEYFLNPDNKATDEPKTILTDLMPKIIEQLGKKEYRQAVFTLIKKELQEKQILLYASNPIIEQGLSWFGWTGEIKEKISADYLAINHANLGGLKSSLNIQQKVKLHSFLDEQGKVTDTLSIIRQHQGNGQWPDHDNNGYLRVLVPKGSILLKAELEEEDVASQVDIGIEKNKTVWGLWFNTPINAKKTLILSYRLPFELANPQDYSLYWQKQPGVISDDLEVVVNDQILYQDEVREDLVIK